MLKARLWVLAIGALLAANARAEPVASIVERGGGQIKFENAGLEEDGPTKIDHFVIPVSCRNHVVNVTIGNCTSVTPMQLQDLGAIRRFGQAADRRFVLHRHASGNNVGHLNLRIDA